MKLRSQLRYAVAVVALGGLAACSNGGRAASPAPPPAVVPPSAEAAAGTVVTATLPPSVARTQDDVQIFSGPAVRESAAATDPGSAGQVIDLNATANDEIGLYVTDGAGRTLYRFDKDKKDSSQPACTGRCAKTWPPLLVGSPGRVYPSGVNPARLGFVERSGGDRQVTIDGQPIYYYSKDKKRGDLKGQGLQGTWFAVAPSGGRTKNKIEILHQPGGN